MSFLIPLDPGWDPSLMQKSISSYSQKYCSHDLHSLRKMHEFSPSLESSRRRTFQRRLPLTGYSHTSVVSDLVFHPFKNGLYTQIVSVSMDKSLKVWDQEDHSYNMSETITTLDPLLTVAWSPNGRYVASAGTGRIVYIHTGFHKKNISLKHRLKRHYEDIVSLQFSSDSALLFSASLDTRIHVWDSEEGTIRQTLCHTFPVPLLVFSNHVTSMCINNLGSFVASVCNEDDSQSRLRLWDLEGFKDFPTVNNSDSRCVPQANRRALSCSVTRNSLLSVLNEDRSVSLYSVICSPPSLKHMSRTKNKDFYSLTREPARSRYSQSSFKIFEV
ncbi:TAF5 [Lepeophtheirus salmonis]|uniref:TAF5 n=1 Tax=Lepeophtheirus salmonis TaxID=72036 RepID=A0A7R8CCB1_LEPSM|nr:TAF5 [Lepeophtheirus salmonis]CAF2769368.1 TAF5 [Lepeophtheirus salmonis]